MLRITPENGKFVLKELPDEPAAVGKIMLSKNLNKPHKKAIVVAVPNSNYLNGADVPIAMSVGDTVYFDPHCGYDREEFVITDYQSIIGVIEKD